MGERNVEGNVGRMPAECDVQEAFSLVYINPVAFLKLFIKQRKATTIFTLLMS